MRKIPLTMIVVLFSGIVFGQFESATKYAETISEEDLKDYLNIIASDAMEGRETGERGQKMAAAFIAYNFKEIGLEPVVKDGNGLSYFQEVPLERSYPGEIYVEAKGVKMMNGQDIVYWGRKNMATPAKVSAVYVGPGSNEVYKQIDVAGKAVIIEASGTGFRQWRTLSRTAADAGAEIAFIIVASDDSYGEMLLQYSSYFKGPSLGFKSNDSAGNGIFLISQSAAAQLLNTTTEDLLKANENIASGEHGALKKIKSTPITYKLERISEEIISENVLGFLEGTDKKDEIIVVTSHYDHLGKRGDDINNGADDDGSGTSAVIEIAQAFAEAKKAGNGPRRSILFMTVTGEEKGLLGSQYYVENPVFPLENTVVNLNIDMIGRFDPDHDENREFIYLVGSDRLSTELHELSEMVNATFTHLDLDYTYNDENHPERIYYRSDHWNFAKKGIPIIFYFSGIHEDYHKPTDTVDKIEFELLKKRADLVYYTAWVLANREDRIVADKLQESTPIDSK